MPVVPLAVRPASLGDADALCDAHVGGWRDGYRDIFDDSYLDAPEFESSRREMWRSGRWLDQPGQRTFAGLVDDRVLGYSMIGAERTDGVPNDSGRGEIRSFYLQQTAWGTGLAGLLMDASLEWLRETGFTEATLWVLRDNPRARAFYARTGWAWNGEEAGWAGPIAFGVPTPSIVAEVRYARAL
ncbi:MAG: GCN5-related N-acetyltransferase [Ilumatobacteraceae bacterium]|nr:GCN5-related N-acetyltransferase [Ilumatobacteraceae bacterium]